MCEVAEATAFLDDVLGQLKSDLVGLPASTTRDSQTRARLETAIDTILERAADRAGDRAVELRAPKTRTR